MISNTRNWSIDTTENKKDKKNCFNAHLARCIFAE